jgi:hypothetical protein
VGCLNAKGRISKNNETGCRQLFEKHWAGNPPYHSQDLSKQVLVCQSTKLPAYQVCVAGSGDTVLRKVKFQTHLAFL